MEKDKNKTGNPVKESLNDEAYISQGGISNEEIERFEVGEEGFERESGSHSPEDEVSVSEMDPSINHKGNISVQESTLTTEEKMRFDQEAENVKGDGDIGEGRAQGADRA